MINAKVSGLPELLRALGALKLRIQKTYLRRALMAGGRVFRDEARSRTPVINPSSLPVRKGYRKPGTARKSIGVGTSRSMSNATRLAVRVKSRPGKGAKIGTRSPSDPYYFRWLELGTKKMRAFGMLSGAFAAKGKEALAQIEKSLRDSIARDFGGKK